MTREVPPTRVAPGVHPVSIVALPLPLVCAPVGRFAPPPWDRNSADWRRLDDQLPQDHRARQVDQAVGQLDLAPLFAAYAGTGSPAPRPAPSPNGVLFTVR